MLYIHTLVNYCNLDTWGSRSEIPRLTCVNQKRTPLLVKRRIRHTILKIVLEIKKKTGVNVRKQSCFPKCISDRYRVSD